MKSKCRFTFHIYAFNKILVTNGSVNSMYYKYYIFRIKIYRYTKHTKPTTSFFKFNFENLLKNVILYIIHMFLIWNSNTMKKKKTKEALSRVILSLQGNVCCAWWQENEIIVEELSITNQREFLFYFKQNAKLMIHIIT